MSTALASRSRYIPWLFVAGFAVVISVNAIMITFAVSSFSGLSTPKPRDRGLRYNTIVAAQQSQDALGWRVDTAWRADANRLELAVSDASGRPLTAARVSAELVRPVEKRAPIGVALDDLGNGRFGGRAELPARGNWDLDVVVERDGQRFAVTRRMFLQ
ncbi:MAG: FixH family protein [Alphaproteobacteria bacterium]|nr:FixH family protein [Alphaproteobacteria bacterium]